MVKTDNITINSKISELPLVGPALTKAFQSAKVFTIADLLYYFPTRYMDYRKTVGIGAAAEGETITIIGKVKTIRANFGFRGRMPYAEAVIEDGTGKIRAVWFNQSYIAKQLTEGADVILSGKVSRYKQLQLTNPAYDLIDAEVASGKNLHTGRLVPIYKRGDQLPLRTMRKIIKSCLHLAEDLEDYIPSKIKSNSSEELLSITDAVTFLHFPETDEQVAQARFRIAVDDVLPQQLAVELKNDAESKRKGYAIVADIDQVKAFLKTLPFELTPSQKRAAWDIFQDISSGKPMNRLLQGDVGSGKTIVAILAAMQFAKSKMQTAVLAPTEILAKQHYETFLALLKKQPNCSIALLTRTFALIDGKEFTKTEVNEKLAAGKITICIGTHALLQGKSEFKKLALVVIDEQHRFGVAQRSFLLTERAHLLSMSATPIPRTLAMSLYADLSVSTLSHVPSGRKPIITAVVPESKRKLAYDFVKSEVEHGHQAFVVTPRVEDTDTSEVRSVKKEFTRLQAEVFPKLRLGLLYGKMKGVEKDSVMADFAAGKLDILVATSVIEIGIDIPLATAMIIEGSERFGLAQLHQLRGRVGRNNFESRCFLFTTEDSHQETARLSALAKSNDGFALAELDLAQRGFGDLFGKQQSGFMFRYPQFITVKALKTARNLAAAIYKNKKEFDKSSNLFAKAREYLEEIHNE
jgi:ATP-dependent DNA helicase RecG